MIIQSRKRNPAPPAQCEAVGLLTREVINQRFAAAIANTRNMPVLREDMLGEGEGAWDPDPRYPTDTVNCLIWLQLIISEIYGWEKDLQTKIQIMDQIRYFSGWPAYGLRKSHFIDHWLLLEPEPLVRIRLENFPGYSRCSVKYDKKRFKEFHNYPGRLYREELDTFTIQYVTGDGLLDCVGDLTPGFYISFGVAGPYYESLYGRGQGAMGLVHSLIIRIRDAADIPGGQRSCDQAVVYHASIVSGRVNELPLPEYIEKMSVLFRGYALLQLDPNWDFRAPRAIDDEIKHILQCEGALSCRDNSRKL